MSTRGDTRLPDRTGAPSPPLRVNSAEPRLLGIPSWASLLIGIAAVAGGALLLARGGVALGSLALALGAALTALAIGAARRWPRSRIPRASGRTARAIGTRLRLVRVLTATWSRTARRSTRLHRRLQAAREERERLNSALGEAAYREDADQVAVRRERLQRLDRRIEALERELERVAARAKARVERERASGRETVPYAVAEADPDPGHDGRTRPVPTAERRAG